MSVSLRHIEHAVELEDTIPYVETHWSCTIEYTGVYFVEQSSFDALAIAIEIQTQKVNITTSRL